jgi:hypothetical protein
MKRPTSPKAMRAFLDLMERERRTMLDEILQVRGLMPLLMKPRNQLDWTPADKRELKVHLKRLSRMSPYLIVIIAPGGFFMLPAIAWWLDRRRGRSRDFNPA